MKQFLTFVRKEFYHVFRDKKTLLMLFGLPIVQIVLFGFALTNEIKNSKIVICDYAKDEATQQIINKIEASHNFEIQKTLFSHKQIEEAFKEGNIKLAIIFPANFNKDLSHLHQAQAQIIADASDPNTANTLTNYATAIIMDYQQELIKNNAVPFRIVPEIRMLYNPELKGALWLLLMIISYASTDQIFNALDPASDIKYLLFCLALNAVLIATFYFNYFIIIPKYLLTKKYLLYFLFLLFTIATVLFLSVALLTVSGFTPETSAETDPVIEKIIPVILVNAISLWLIIIVSSVLWAIYNRLKQTENEKLMAQIATLKSQINPHFLFNTLNNIYATAIDTSPKTADMIDKLSEMMRYTMKDTQQDFVPLEDEINYINNFIELQKLRLDRSVKLEYHTLENVPEFQIAPMLLIPFIENAFKHGVNSEQKSRIKIEITISKADFQLSVVNNKVNVQKDIAESNGLGIENTKHRLNLIYPSKHLLIINDREKEFSVSLHINLQ